MKFNHHHQELTLRNLNFNDDEVIFTVLLNEMNDYFEDYQDNPPTQTDVTEFFEDLPPATKLEQKTLLGVFIENKLIGFIDYLADFPKPKTTMIGYLVLAKAYRGQGLGQKLYNWLEAECTKQGVETLRLGVIISNQPAVKFWEKQGYLTLDSYETDYGRQQTMEKKIN